MAPADLLTKDDVPLRVIADLALTEVDVFNDEASRGFIDRFSTEVDSRTFMTRTGDVTWDEIAESVEHAELAAPFQDYHMAFNVKEYAKSLGMTRKYIEDSPRSLIEDDITEIIAGGRQKMFDVTFDVLKNGIADGSTLWYDPEDHGAYTFTNTHDHTYTGFNNNSDVVSNVLFDDTSAHTPTEIVREMSKELTHHGYDPDTMIVDQDFADYFIEERHDGFGSSFHVPAAENMVTTDVRDQDLTVNGVDIIRTSWLKPDSADNDHTLYMYDSSVQPVARHTVRPMELTDNTGNPIGGAGGARGDPGALLGAYGTMRFGTKFRDPLAGVKVEEVQDAAITTS